MKNYRITDKANTYTRISKIKARGFYYEGSTNIVACASDVRPGFPFAMHCPLITGNDFDTLINSMEYYNLQNSSDYLHYYLVTPNDEKPMTGELDYEDSAESWG